jgi:hypothetical protein
MHRTAALCRMTFMCCAENSQLKYQASKTPHKHGIISEGVGPHSVYQGIDFVTHKTGDMMLHVRKLAVSFQRGRVS